MKTTLRAAVSMTALFFGSAVFAASALEEGKKIAFNVTKGSCVTCHMMDDGAQPGNYGPPLMQMKLRYPNKADLRKQIWDATQRNPMTTMPPFGPHRILTEQEIDLVTEYVHSL